MKTCAWISRHPPTREQRASLNEYQIVQINPPGRLWSAADAVVLSQNRCGGWPDLFVVVMPFTMLKQFLNKVDGRAPIVRGVYATRKDGVQWTGHWEQVVHIHIQTERWIPGRKELR